MMQSSTGRSPKTEAFRRSGVRVDLFRLFLFGLLSPLCLRSRPSLAASRSFVWLVQPCFFIIIIPSSPTSI